MDLLTYKQVSERYNIHLDTLYHWVSRKTIPHIRLGTKTVRFDRHALEKWLSDQFVPDKRVARHEQST